MLVKQSLGALSILVLANCAAGLQTPNPALVGHSMGKPQYSISGYTSWGEMRVQAAKNQSLGYMREMCADEPEFVDIQTFDASRMGHSQLGWSAIFVCSKLRVGS